MPQVFFFASQFQRFLEKIFPYTMVKSIWRLWYDYQETEKDGLRLGKNPNSPGPSHKPFGSEEISLLGG